MAKPSSRPLIFLLLMVLSAWLYLEGGKDYLSLEYVQERVFELKDLQEQRPWYLLSAFTAIFVLMIAVSLPGTIILTLLAGALYGGFWGTIIVELASTLGATLSFFLSRYLLKDFLKQKLKEPYRRMNEKFEREGLSYLFALRLFPAAPFVLINSVMGLTGLGLWNYIWITLVGMLPGNLLYVLAGRELSTLTSPTDILTAPIIIGLIILGLLPAGWRAMRRHALSHSLGHNGRGKKLNKG